VTRSAKPWRALATSFPVAFASTTAALNAIEGDDAAARSWIIIAVLFLIADDVRLIRRRLQWD